MRHPSSPALLVFVGLVLTVASAERASAWSPAAQQDRLAPGPPHETNIVVGELPPASFVLDSIDDETFDLEQAEGPLLLLFFRGTW